MIALAKPRMGNAGPKPAFPEHISPSAAKLYLGCSLKFYFERVARIRKPTPVALHLGKAVHAALQAFHLARWRGGDDSAPATQLVYEQAFSRLEAEEGPVDYAGEENRTKALDAGVRVIQAYLESPEVLRERPLGVEVSLKEQIPGLDVPLTGTLDLVLPGVIPVDFKSAASRQDREQVAFDHELQLVTYQLLLEHAALETPSRLDLLVLVKTKTPQVARMSVPPADPARKERVIRMLDTAVQGIAEERFHPQPGMQCSRCAFRAECATWPEGVCRK